MFNLFYYSMKNIKLFSLLFVAAAMIFAGCTKETESVEPGGGEGTEEGLVYKEFKVGASEAGGSKSRTVLGSDGKSVLWQVGDEIRVFADVDGANADGYKFTVTEIQDGGKTATIGGEVANANRFYALYSHDVYSKTGGFIKKSEDSICVCANIPDEQSVSYNGGYDPRACISVAELNSENGATFKLACGMIGLNFINNTGYDIVKIQIVFDDYAFHQSNGGIDITIKDPNNKYTGYPNKFYEEPLSRTISLQPSESSKFLDNKMYYVCLPPFKSKQTIKIKFINSDGIAITKSVGNVQIKRGEISNFNSVLSLNVEDLHRYISDTEDFILWYNKEIDIYPQVSLSSDIDMNGKEPLTAKDFSGIFNGNNYSIKNLTMIPNEYTSSNGLFSSIDGATISELKLTGFIAHGGNFIGTIAGQAKSTNKTTKIEGCRIEGAELQNGTFVGGLVGQFNGGEIECCEIVNINMSSTITCGGLIGSFNNGFLRASYVTGNLEGNNIGGLLGIWGDDIAKVTSCYSYTNIPEKGDGIQAMKMHSSTVSHSYYVNDDKLHDGITTSDLISEQTIKDMNNAVSTYGVKYLYIKNENVSVDNPVSIENPPLILEKVQSN